jgi:hypothetical protein
MTTKQDEARLIAFVNQAVQEATEKAGGKPTPGMQLLIDDLRPFALENLNAREMIKRAEQNFYDDLIGVPDMPTLTLIRHCERAGLETIGRNAIHGKYED